VGDACVGTSVREGGVASTDVTAVKLMSNFISSASDRKRKKNKIKQLYNTTQRNEKHRQNFVHTAQTLYVN